MFESYDIHVTPQALIDFAWSAPMRDLAAKVGLSDVGLKKKLRAWGVVTPPAGHWNKVHAGRPVPNPPTAPDRRPGETGLISIERRVFAGHIATSAPIPIDGPFISRHVPEDLDSLEAQELKAIGRPRSAMSMTNKHKSIAEFIARDDKARAKAESSHWMYQPLRDVWFDSPLEKRKLRILNAIFLTLEHRNHRATADVFDYQLNISAHIGNTPVALILEPARYRNPTRYGLGSGRSRETQESKGVLLELHATANGVTRLWRETEASRLENQIAPIVAAIIRIGEESFRRQLRIDVEREQKWRLEEEARRAKRLQEANAARKEALLYSGRRLAEAMKLRELVTEVGSAVEAGAIALSPEELHEWRTWALSCADEIDPVKSRQVLAHLRPPHID